MGRSVLENLLYVRIAYMHRGRYCLGVFLQKCGSVLAERFTSDARFTSTLADITSARFKGPPPVLAQ